MKDSTLGSSPPTSGASAPVSLSLSGLTDRRVDGFGHLTLSHVTNVRYACVTYVRTLHIFIYNVCSDK